MDLYIFKIMLYSLLGISFIALGFAVYMIISVWNDLFKEEGEKDER